MQKQTVSERYEQQQIMKGEKGSIKPDIKHLQTSQHLQKIFKQMEQALLQAHQSVRQAEIANPIQPQLQQANQRLLYATEKMQQLKTSAPELTLGLPTATQQQVNQLDHHIQQASQTLQLIQKSFGNQ